MPPLALVVDSNEESMARLSSLFNLHDFSFDCVTSNAQAKEFILQRRPEFLLVNLDDSSDLTDRSELLEFLSNSNINSVTDIYLMSRSPTYKQALTGLRLGASDLFEYPGNLDRLADSLRHFREGDVETDSQTARGLLLGESGAMERLFNVIRKVAPSEVSVFLSGESGTGKELAARTIHELSPRRQGPFVAVNCGAIAAELAESEIFGHVKGAFTGAGKAHNGYFAQAEGGTLFLDEVTEMKLDLQVKLLRVLESHTYQAVGAECSQNSDVRVITSTNRDVEQAVEEGVLRQDLFYRIAQFPVQIPPLRERGDDVILLANRFLAEQCEKSNIVKTFSADALDLLRLHHWPGNVRELRNLVARAYLLAGDEVTLADFPADLLTEDKSPALKPAGEKLEKIEKRTILATLEHYQGNKTKAAKALGISLKTLYNRLKRYDEDAADAGVSRTRQLA